MSVPLLLSAAISALAALLAVTYKLLDVKLLAHAAVLALAAVAAAQAVSQTPLSWIPVALAAAVEAVLLRGDELWR